MKSSFFNKNYRITLSVVLVAAFSGSSCGGGDSFNPLSSSAQNVVASTVFSVFAFALTGYWVQDGVGLRVDANSIEVRNGCASFNFSEPYDAISESGGLAIRGRVSSAGDLVLFLKVMDGSGGTKLALTLRDSGGGTLVSAPSMSRTTGPLTTAPGC
jgi:hypothetical protein